jgi:type I restriction-modification system DNA methylase subunit
MAKKGTYVSHDTRVKEMIKLIESIGYRHGISTVFDDYLTIASCAVSNAVDKVHFDERESLYMQTIKKYSKEELQKIVELHAMVVNALEQSLYSSDLLGELYHSLNLSNSRNGQFFTPIHIAEFMAEAMLGSKCTEIEEKGYVTLCEPTCGSGVMVIAAANSLYKNHYNPSQNMCVLAVDNDIRCARMAYIQLSYLGIPAVVVHGDSLAMQEYARFYTPVYVMGGWIWREPMTLANGFCVDDENLKCMLEPMYGLLKYEINAKKENEDGQVSGNA